MGRKNGRFIAAAVWIMAGSFFAGCGRSTVNPPKSPETQESGQETEAQMGSGEAEITGDLLTGGATGSVDYEIKKQERSYSAENGTAIFELELSYPVFLGEEEGIRNINQYFENWAKQKLEGYEESENSTIRDALEVYRESRDSAWAGPWSEDCGPSFVKTWNGYVSVLMDSYLYEGGSHGMPYREGMVFRISDGKKTKLSELTGMEAGEVDKLLREGFSDIVADGAEGEYFEDALEQLKERDMKDTGYYFADAGIRFYLPPYEIGPYSTGYVELEIPYEEFTRDAQKAAIAR